MNRLVEILRRYLIASQSVAVAVSPTRPNAIIVVTIIIILCNYVGIISA